MTVKELIEALREYPDDTNVEIYTKRYNDSTFIEHIESGGEGFVELVVNDDRWDMVKIPADATNGDVIMAMFPNVEIEQLTNMTIAVWYEVKGDCGKWVNYSIDWWNAKYKG